MQEVVEIRFSTLHSNVQCESGANYTTCHLALGEEGDTPHSVAHRTGAGGEMERGSLAFCSPTLYSPTFSLTRSIHKKRRDIILCSGFNTLSQFQNNFLLHKYVHSSYRFRDSLLWGTSAVSFCKVYSVISLPVLPEWLWSRISMIPQGCLSVSVCYCLSVALPTTQSWMACDQSWLVESY